MKKLLPSVVMVLVVSACSGADSGETTTSTVPTLALTATTSVPVTTTSVPATTIDPGPQESPTTIPAPTVTATTVDANTTIAAVPVAPSTDLPPIVVLKSVPVVVDDIVDGDKGVVGGYQRLGIGAEVGDYGSYAIAVPAGWVYWVLGDDPEEIVAITADKDPLVSESLDQELSESNAAVSSSLEGFVAYARGHFIDPDVPFYLAGTVGLNSDYDFEFDELLEETRTQYTDAGLEILRLEDFPSEGGGSVESTVRGGSGVDAFIQHRSLVLDKEHGWLWSVVCDVDESGAAESDEACWTMIRSFHPFGLRVE